MLARVQTQLSLKRAVDQIRQLEQRLEQRNQDLEAANRDLSAANDRMQRDLRAAARIQEAMLPASLPLSQQARFAWLFRPCAEVAGDSLNIFQLDDEHVGMYVLDVVGHGVAAALLSVAVSRVLTPTPNSFLLRPREGGDGYRLLPPGEVAAQLSKRFPWEMSTEQFFTLLYGVIDLRTREWRFVCSRPSVADLSAARRRSRGFCRVAARCRSASATTPYEEQVLVLDPGDRLYLYSDGISEAMNARGETFQMECMVRALAENRDAPLDDTLAALWRAVEAWCGGTSLHDDASLAALEIVVP